MMLTIKEHKSAQIIIEQITDINDVLQLLGNTAHVETTIGLVDINSASPHEVGKCDKARYLHNRHSDIEAQLKTMCRALLREKLAEQEEQLKEYIRKE